MGGVSLLLYGVIGASGIRVLIESKVDYSKAQNLILTSVILIIGVSGAKVHIGAAELKGMALATIVGVGEPHFQADLRDPPGRGGAGR